MNNFNAVFLIPIFREAAEKYINAANSCVTISEICNTVSSIVKSEDSNLSGEWTTLGETYSSIAKVSINSANSLNNIVELYSSSTVKNEESAANVSKQTKSKLDEANEKLDALLGNGGSGSSTGGGSNGGEKIF